MNKFKTLLAGIFLLGLIQWTFSQDEKSLKHECLQTMHELNTALADLQIRNKEDVNYGAIQCPHCNILHTRAAEAVFPFAMEYQQTGDKNFLLASIDLGNWLIKQQYPGGEWQETPEDWTGTTTDQLLMMAMAYPVIAKSLSAKEKENWINSIRNAADYLTREMSPDFASINYCATTTATLMIANQVVPDEKYTSRARTLAHEVVAKMDEDYFLFGEGGRVFGIKYGVDLGYNMEMSLWGLSLYSRLAEDKLVENIVRKSLKIHLNFVYPDGSIDGSWGIRSNKWTTYGGATSDGCQIMFGLHAHENNAYGTAALKNLEYLRGMIKEGLVGYGPHYYHLYEKPPCIYPTFAKAKNLAMTLEYTTKDMVEPAKLPSDEIGKTNYFKTVQVVTKRTKNFMATISAYGYKDIEKGYKSKYMYRPTGGSICNLWVLDYGFLQASSQTQYQRWEPMHFPEAEGILPITPRIEHADSNGYFTNLYEFDGILSIESGGNNTIVSTRGELKNMKQQPCGISYIYSHEFSDDYLVKKVKVSYHGIRSDVSIVEPIIWHENMEFEMENDHSVLITSSDKKFRFEIIEGDAELLIGGIDKDKFWSPYPSLRAFPIILEVPYRGSELSNSVSYKLSIIN
ncbi:MAG TPA: hypothetical protein ENI20_10670 [Bacteroides sp.]|nr:hypothetical protein [Bacteroides sp.]